jgi:hypothetical protein
VRHVLGAPPAQGRLRGREERPHFSCFFCGFLPAFDNSGGDFAVVRRAFFNMLKKITNYVISGVVYASHISFHRRVEYD